MLQESVSDDMRGRTFGTLYTIVRLCLLISLTIWPFIAGASNAIFEHAVGGKAHLGSFGVALPGFAGRVVARRRVHGVPGLAAQRARCAVAPPRPTVRSRET